VVGIIEGKLGGGDSTKDRDGAERFRGSGGVSVTGVHEGEGELVRKLRHGDVVLMVLLAREENGWNFGSTRNKTAAGSEIAGAVFWAAHAREEEEERVRKG
jgi:hypothetical protein